jgi:hypothetical protein
MVIFNQYPSNVSGYLNSVVHLSIWKQSVVTQLQKD